MPSHWINREKRNNASGLQLVITCIRQRRRRESSWRSFFFSFDGVSQSWAALYFIRRLSTRSPRFHWLLILLRLEKTTQCGIFSVYLLPIKENSPQLSFFRSLSKKKKKKKSTTTKHFAFTTTRWFWLSIRPISHYPPLHPKCRRIAHQPPSPMRLLKQIWFTGKSITQETTSNQILWPLTVPLVSEHPILCTSPKFILTSEVTKKKNHLILFDEHQRKSVIRSIIKDRIRQTLWMEELGIFLLLTEKVIWSFDPSKKEIKPVSEITPLRKKSFKSFALLNLSILIVAYDEWNPKLLDRWEIWP